MLQVCILGFIMVKVIKHFIDLNIKIMVQINILLFSVSDSTNDKSQTLQQITEGNKGVFLNSFSCFGFFSKMIIKFRIILSREQNENLNQDDIHKKKNYLFFIVNYGSSFIGAPNHVVIKIYFSFDYDFNLIRSDVIYQYEI